MEKKLLLKLESLARLRLSDAERRSVAPEIEEMTAYFNKLQQLDTDGIEPLVHALPLCNVMREDTVLPSLPQEAVTQNARTENGYFTVPRTVGGDAPQVVPQLLVGGDAHIAPQPSNQSFAELSATDNPFKNLTATQLAAKIRAGGLTVPQVTEYYLNKADTLNAFITKNENALAEAEAIQKRIERGEALSPLAGVPVAVKDNLCTKNMRTTCASKMLESFIPPYDATAVAKLKAAGMVILGKTNMDEFAMGSTGENSAFGAVFNPNDKTRVAGGSSSGSAAAVCGSLAPLAIGSDTGGSVRLPAAYCGIYGLKPTYGAVSRYGLIAYASSLDTVGTLCKSVADTAALYEIIRGSDTHDATSMNSLPTALRDRGDLRGIRIAAFDSTDTAAVASFKALGAAVETVHFPLLDYAVPAYYILACAEASSNLARYDGIRYGYRGTAQTPDEIYLNSRSKAFGAEVKKRIMLGNFVLSAGYYDAYYLKALQVKARLAEALGALLKQYDFILAPVTENGAPLFGQASPMEQYRADCYNVLANLSGLPALSLPCGVQLLGRAREENALLSAAAVWERGQSDAL